MTPLHWALLALGACFATEAVVNTIMRQALVKRIERLENMLIDSHHRPDAPPPKTVHKLFAGPTTTTVGIGGCMRATAESEIFHD